jgi:hypothetical protein
MSNRVGSPGNGGGVSLPVQKNDFINNLFSNISDYNQFGAPGHDWLWTSGQDTFTCSMSYTGTSSPYTVTAVCLPIQSDISSGISKVASSSSGVTITPSATSRWDPMLCTTGPPSYNPGVPATCIANGWTTVVSNHTGWNGTFAMTGTSGNFVGDGTGGSNIVYSDTTNNPTSGTCLCDNGTSTTCTNSPPKCTGSGGALASGDVTFASLAYKMTDISPPSLSNPQGDDIDSSNVGGDTTCLTNG